ncbi:unnamed protein product [Aureobasidium mustum]|uniref:Uncharacterized protein n=1 Tax=Aureobasidium mustum TaxID=2773714 RepID=A0A9N8JSW8_9PEZI|nr:unnamed protein product [Aureobasidium mustum]
MLVKKKRLSSRADEQALSWGRQPGRGRAACTCSRHGRG